MFMNLKRDSSIHDLKGILKHLNTLVKWRLTLWVAREETAPCLDVDNLARLSNHLAQVHKMDREERKKWLKWSKIGICVPLKNKDASEKDLYTWQTLSTKTLYVVKTIFFTVNRCLWTWKEILVFKFKVNGSDLPSVKPNSPQYVLLFF